MKTASLEYELIRSLTEHFPRCPRQINGLGESDAELLRLPGGSILAVTTDCIAEEISAGLYDPWLAGWMAVVANLSDLAAVGARPLGLLLSETLDRKWNPGQIRQLQQGIADAAEACGTGVLGGDTNFGDRTAITGTAFGICENARPISRKGMAPDDGLYISSPAGIGSAFAASRLEAIGDVRYRPLPALSESIVVRQHASACMDNSDGLLPTLDELMRVNGFGFTLPLSFEDILHPDAMDMSEKLSLPQWMFLAGPHGDYSLVFTIPAPEEENFLTSCTRIGWKPLKIGHVTKRSKLTLTSNGSAALCDSRVLRNLTFDFPNPHDLIKSLLNSESNIFQEIRS